jgi:hypothetical protein
LAQLGVCPLRCYNSRRCSSSALDNHAAGSSCTIFGKANVRSETTCSTLTDVTCIQEVRALTLIMQHFDSRGAASFGGFARRHFNLIVLAGLTLVVVVLYWPALTAYFVSDDYGLIYLPVFHLQAILDGRMWREWFLGVGDGYLFFRPVTYVFYLLDYLAWDLTPFGYHLSSVLLHSLTSFMVYLAAWRLMRDRVIALGAAGVFAVMPVHAAAVSWFAAKSDIVCGFFYLTSFLFFVLYRQGGRLRNLAISLAAFALALMSKEIGILVPASMLVYEILFYYKDFIFWGWVKRHIPFWVMLGSYLWFRFSVLGSFGYRGTQLSSQDIENWVTGAWLNTVDPFFTDLSHEGRWIILGVFLLLLLVSRSRNAILFGIAWIPLISLATINSISGWSDRSFYVATFGLSLSLAILLIQTLQRWRSNWRFIGPVALVVLGIVYGVALYRRNQSFNQAGQVAESILGQVKALYPEFPPGARLVFVGVPDRIPDGQLVFFSGFERAVRIVYHDDQLQVSKYDKFPIWFYQLDKLFYFSVEHRHVTPRQDVVQALEQRAQCGNVSRLALAWDFSKDLQGWEPWNQLTAPQTREGALVTQSQGDDPNLGSPPLSIPAIAIGDIAITMRVRAAQPQFQGTLFWMASGNDEFNPGQSQSFKVIADGEYHQYNVDIASKGQLLVGDEILQLRLDPVDGPAEVAIKSVQINTHCDALNSLECTCGVR